MRIHFGQKKTVSWNCTVKNTPENGFNFGLQDRYEFISGIHVKCITHSLRKITRSTYMYITLYTFFLFLYTTSMHWRAFKVSILSLPRPWTGLYLKSKSSVPWAIMQVSDSLSLLGNSRQIESPFYICLHSLRFVP